MKKGASLILIIFLVLLIGGGAILAIRFLAGGNEDTWICQDGQWVKHGNPSATKPNTPCPGSTETAKQQVTGQPTVEPTSKEVPPQTEEDIIRTFFNLINEKRIPEAISMMSNQAVGNESTKQAWGVQFNAIKSIRVMAIEPSMKENWTADEHSYKTTLEVSMSSDAANAPIPYYGWGDNPNIRWVVIVKEGNLWKISGLATGP